MPPAPIFAIRPNFPNRSLAGADSIAPGAGWVGCDGADPVSWDIGKS